MSEPRKHCPNAHGDDATGRYMFFCPSTESRRACDVYYCAICDEIFALTYDGMFCPVPDEAVTP